MSGWSVRHWCWISQIQDSFYTRLFKRLSLFTQQEMGTWVSSLTHQGMGTRLSSLTHQGMGTRLSSITHQGMGTRLSSFTQQGMGTRLSSFTQQEIGTWLSSELGKVKAVRSGNAPYISYTVTGTSWLSNSNFPAWPLAKDQPFMGFQPASFFFHHFSSPVSFVFPALIGMTSV